MERICEPELMDDPHQAKAYAEADFDRSDQAFTVRIQTLLSAWRQGGEEPLKILDLGCGPGNISFRLAAALPQAQVLGIDGAPQMLALAERRRHAQWASCPLLRFHQALLPVSTEALANLPPAFAPPYDLIVSNSLLHHLHAPAVLWQAVRQLGARGALVVVRDLRRPPTMEALQELVERHASSAPAVLRRDFVNSLAAAFLSQEVEAQLEAAGLAHFAVQAVEDRYLEISGQLAEPLPSPP